MDWGYWCILNRQLVNLNVSSCHQTVKCNWPWVIRYACMRVKRCTLWSTVILVLRLLLAPSHVIYQQAGKEPGDKVTTPNGSSYVCMVSACSYTLICPMFDVTFTLFFLCCEFRWDIVTMSRLKRYENNWCQSLNNLHGNRCSQALKNGEK